MSKGTKKRDRFPGDQRIDAWIRADTYDALYQQARDERVSMGFVIERALRSALGLPPAILKKSELQSNVEPESDKGAKGGEFRYKRVNSHTASLAADRSSP